MDTFILAPNSLTSQPGSASEKSVPGYRSRGRALATEQGDSKCSSAGGHRHQRHMEAVSFGKTLGRGLRHGRRLVPG